MKEQEINILISGGGTGGHIFPAIAIAQALQAIYPAANILFVGAQGKMEMTKVPEAGYPIESLWISGLQRKLSAQNLLFPFKLISSLLKARRIIKRFKPHVAIGVGGFASGPTLYMAARLGIPCLIQEQNAYPGITNKLLAKHVQKICVAYTGMERFFPQHKLIITGNPIRKALSLPASKAEALAHFHLDHKMPTVLIVGGSLGARSINRAVMQHIEDWASAPFQLLWQTGELSYEEVTQVINSTTKVDNIHHTAFIKRMDLAYAAADLVISRAGAIAISELSLLGLPTIFVPFPHAAEDHQTKNAMSLVEKDAAWIINDMMVHSELYATVSRIMNLPEERANKSRQIKKLARGGAENEIAKAALQLAGYQPSTADSPTTTAEDDTEITASDQPITDDSTTDSAATTPPPQSTIPSADNTRLNVCFIGIGGIGMSAIAQYYLLQGAQVIGYDRNESPITRMLQQKGAFIFHQEQASMLPQSWVEASNTLYIYTPAIPKDSPLKTQVLEIAPDRLFKRAEILGKLSLDYKTLAVAGTHGKTTISSMLTQLMDKSLYRSNAFLGGISKSLNSNFMWKDKAEYMVVEADEFDRSFLHLHPHAAIITAMDADHLDIYGNKAAIEDSFKAFAQQVSPQGLLLVKKGLEHHFKQHKPLTYSLYDTNSDFYTANLKLEDGLYHFDIHYPGGCLQNLQLSMLGLVNVENAVAACALSLALNFGTSHIAAALLSFEGIKRRMEKIVDNKHHVFIDDYAHHPEELHAAIQSVQALYPQLPLCVVFQPHLYSRTRDFAEAFATSLEAANQIILLDIYPARERPIAGVSSQIILDKIKNRKKTIMSKQALLEHIKNEKPPLLLTLGAGDIDKIIPNLKTILS